MVADGRNADRLAQLSTLGADAIVQLSGDPGEDARAIPEAAPDTDVVIDYLWGPPAASTLQGVLEARSDPASPLRWVHIGAIAGPTIVLPGTALRSHNLTVLGSGQGSISLAEMAGELPSLLELLATKQLDVDSAQSPLSEVESIWHSPLAYDKRVVLQP